MSWFPWLDGFDVGNGKTAGDAVEDVLFEIAPGAGGGVKAVREAKRRYDNINATTTATNEAISAATNAVNDADTLFNTNADGTKIDRKAAAAQGAPAQTSGYGDAPANGTTSDAPVILGYEDYPGEIPTSNVSRYNSTMPYTEWADMGKKEKLAAKEALYNAGYYGKTGVPVMNNTVTAADRDALTGAMTDANLSNVGDWRIIAASAAEGGSSAAADAAQKAARQRAAGRATAIKSLEAYAYDNGIKLPGDFMAKKANQIAAGVKSVDEVTNQLTERFVARQYPALADDLKAGLSVREAAAPYISTYAQLLEVPDSQVDLNDPLLKKALQGVNDKGEPAYTPMWKFEEQLKQDKRWQYTNNAWDEVGSKAMTLMQMFGMAP